MTHQLTPWLILNLTPGLGPIKQQALRSYFSSVEAIIHAPSHRLRACGLSPQMIKALHHPDYAKIDKALTWQEAQDQHIVTYDAANYPALLRQTHNPPPLLYVKGHLPTQLKSPLAIVGSRSPTPTGIKNSHDFAYSLAGAGMSIISGLALGIDGAAHQGALSAKGYTLAILGCGLDHIYPRRHQDLAEQITQQGGALMSEFPLDALPLAQHFPQRNRLISGICLATLVIEATQRSGSLITAQLALEQNRDIFALPGSIHNKLAAGNHQLIQQGATLVISAKNVLENLDITPNITSTPPQKAPIPPISTPIDHEMTHLLRHIGFETTNIDNIIADSKICHQKINSMLLKLELHGYISRVPGGFMRVQ